MRTEEIRSKTDSELEFDRDSMKKELFDMRFKSTTESLTNPSRIRVLRRGIARINTVLHERAHGVRDQEPRK